MNTEPKLRVSLIATVLNERHTLDALLLGIDRQTRIPDEIIVVDGGSDDGTFERLAAWSSPTKLRVERAPGTTIAAGRNLALALATGDIVAVTDAGTQACPCWLQRLVDAFSDADVDVAAGFFVPAVRSCWDAALAAATLPDVDEIDPHTFLPSSRSVAFRRQWFKGEIVYPEWLDYCEDVVFDLTLRRAGARFVFVPDAVVEFRGRAHPGQFWTQYFRYGRGDGKAGLFPLRHAVRYGMYLGMLTTMIRRGPVELSLMATLGIVYVQGPIRRCLRRSATSLRPRWDTLAAVVMIPFVRLTGDLAKMAGYPVGMFWRLRRYGGVGPAFTWRRIHPRSGLRRP